MRTSLIKAEMSGVAFAVRPDIMQSVVSALNAGAPRAANVETMANNSVEYEVIGSVAVISVDGGMYKRDMSGMCVSVASYEKIVQAIDRAEADTAVDTLLFRVDTPGGSVAGVDEVGDRIFECKKKTVTVYENMGASGGIWAFTAADELYATETTMLGSIGVVVTYLNDTEAEKKTVTIVSKNAKNKRCDLGEDCEKKIKTMINTYEDLFYARVERNTGFDAAKIKSVFNEGDMIFATAAHDAGFIDGIATFKSVLEQLTDATAVMPTEPVADKIAKNSNEGGNHMKITADNLVEAQAALDTATASLDEKAAALEASQAELTKAKAHIEALEAKQEAMPEIVAMSYTHGVTKETALKMVAAGSRAEAALVAMNSKQSGGAAALGDLNGENAVGAEAEGGDDDLVAYAEKHKGSIK